MIKKTIAVFVFGVFLFACQSDKKTAPPTPIIKKNVKVPAFNPDSAFAFIEKQMSFGPRVPGTPEHKACKEWIIAQMTKLGTKVQIQNFIGTFQNLKGIPSTNIIAQVNPNHSKRILLAAHWDTRAVSDAEEDADLKSKPVPGADDGGSGVAILMEIARTIQNNPIDMGVDFVFFDTEDQGNPREVCSTMSCSYCQGAQYWSKNLIPKNYKPEYGILFDMVGAKNASFYKEGLSRAYAGIKTDKIWTLASRMGYNDYFIDRPFAQIIDDHKFVNEIAQIPMLDIVNLKPNVPNQTFQKCWHTQCDDMSVIDKRTLRAVGQVTAAVLYKESGNTL